MSTRVTVDERSAGRGTVQVAVTFDRSALSALGGRAALSSDLDTSGLAAAGWHVTGPSAAPGQGAVVTASHAFFNNAQASQLISDLAGTGPASTRPFQLTLSNRTTFWHVYSDLSGTVDLTCGLDCFGDAGLKAATGNTTGVNPALLLGGKNPAQIFSFEVQARLPGGAPKSNATTRSVVAGEHILGWTPELGRTTVLSAQTEGWNRGSVILVSSLAGGVLLVLLGLTGTWIWRRRRRRGAHARRRLWFRSSPETPPVAGAPAESVVEEPSSR